MNLFIIMGVFQLPFSLQKLFLEVLFHVNMRIIGINLINPNIKTKSFSNMATKPLLKDTFELQNISFGRKKDKEKTDKNKLYKQLRKSGCGEKDTNSVLNNENRYKHLLSLIENQQEFERELALKEMLAIALNEFDEEQTQKFILITGKNIPASRHLSLKEGVSILKNDVDNSKLQRFIDLRDTNKDGIPLLSRQLTPSEACYVCNEDFDNMQAEAFIRLQNIQYNFKLTEFLKDKQNVERFNELTTTNEDGKSLLSRPLNDIEAIQVTMAKFDNEQVQRIIDLTENKLNHSRKLDFDEAQITIKNGLDDEQVQKFIDTKKHVYDLVEETQNQKRYYKPLNDNNIALTVKNNFDEQRTSIFLELANRFFEFEASSMISDEEKYKRLLELTDEKQFALSLSEAGLSVRNNLSDEQVRIYKELIDSKTNSFDAMNFVKDNKNAEQYTNLTTEDKTEHSRILQPNEALLAITKDFSTQEIQELINIKNQNPDLELDYVAILIKFIDFKDKTNLEELNSQEKRNLLKLLVKHSATLFNENVSPKTYPLIPKSQEEYCSLLPKITNSLGINTEPISAEKKQDFYVSIKSLLTSNKPNLDGLFNAIPELKNKDLTNSLNILREVITNSKFKVLNSDDQNCLATAILLKNLSDNSEDSAFDAFYILQRFNLPEDKQLKIYELIKTSDWAEKLSILNKEKANKLAQDIAFETRHSNTFELSKMLVEASLKVQNQSEKITEMKLFADKIDSYLRKLQETQILLPQTQIPKASEMKNCEKITLDDITNTVFYINKAKDSLEQYGFERGTSINNWKSLVHGFDTEQQLQIFTTFSLIDSEALLSTSYITPKEYKGFRKQGLILDVNPNDIHAGYFKDFGSGFKKDIDELKKNYLFAEKNQNSIWRQDRTQYRTYFPNLMKKYFNYSDEEYLQTIKGLQNCKSITDIEKKNKNFANGLLEIFETTKFGERRYDRKYNEILISRPKVQGIFAYGQKYEEIPLFLRKYAQDNDFPIIMFG